MYPWDIHYVKNHQDSWGNLQRPLRLYDDALETNGRWSTSQEGGDLKIDM